MSTRRRHNNKKAAKGDAVGDEFDDGGRGVQVAKARPEEHWRNWCVHMLFDEVPVHSTIFVRVLWGLVMWHDIYRFMASDYAHIRHHITNNQFNFPYYYFEWVPHVSLEWWRIIMPILFLAGAGITFGFFYRLSCIVFFFGFALYYLQEASLYLNHNYLICCMLFIFLFIPAGNYFSVDAWLGRVERKPTIPRWAPMLLRLVESNVYVWAGIAKMNYDWMVLAEPLTHWLPKRHRLYQGKWPAPFADIFDFLITWQGTAYFMSWVGMAYDTFLPVLFFGGGIWRVMGFAMSVVFHGTNKLIFDIGVFPQFALALSFIFFEYDWPLRFLRLIKSFGAPTNAGAGGNRRRGGRGGGGGVLASLAKAQAISATEIVPTKYRDRKTPLTLSEKGIVALCVFVLAQQVLAPFRAYVVYPGDVTWNELGHKYSWRMKLRDKAGFVQCALHLPVPANATDEDPITPPTYEWRRVNSAKILNRKQNSQFAGRPLMIHQFAHYLADKHVRRARKKNEDTERPAVHCLSIAAVNFRHPQFLIDPRVDLASIPVGKYQEKWIVPLLPRDVNASHPMVPRDPAPDVDLFAASKARIRQAYGHLKFDDVLANFIDFEKEGIVAPPFKMPPQ
mmetsp:Transcript_14601/g.36161  ORF Transcript_14601/g.36161 Transcript_14601/m.36161 type:complete len:618 (+) Transcript_14601:159-2012(+)